jgi:ribosomal-protein-alanine N-acetyltransferase
MISRRITTAATIARYYLRPVRRALIRLRFREARRTWGVRLGPVEVSGHRIVLRSPKLGDAPAWRESRLADRDRLSSWWATSEDGWEARHSDAAWITSVLQMRGRARAGLALPLVFEVDGDLAGQCSLEWIAPHTATAELSVWLDTRWSRSGVSGVGAAMVVDYAVTTLGLRRLIAPIAVGNAAAMWGARRIGMRCEGTMERYLDVAGERRDHQLWALTSERVPPGGLTPVMQEAAIRAAAVRAAQPRSNTAR